MYAAFSRNDTSSSLRLFLIYYLLLQIMNEGKLTVHEMENFDEFFDKITNKDD